MKYIDADKLIAEIDKKWKELADKNVKVGGGKWDAEISTYLSVLRLIDSLQHEQPEVDIIPLPEGKMVRYINYCLHREDDDCNCPTCGEHVTGLRLFPYYYDRENNDVYFASVCPECGKIIISKE